MPAESPLVGAALDGRGIAVVRTVLFPGGLERHELADDESRSVERVPSLAVLAVGQRLQLVLSNAELPDGVVRDACDGGGNSTDRVVGEHLVAECVVAQLATVTH